MSNCAILIVFKHLDLDYSLFSIRRDLIDILEARKKTLRPEQFINNAVKLDKSNANRLIELAAGSDLAFDFDGFSLDPASIKSPSIKIMLLRYFAGLPQAEAAAIIGK